MRVIVGCEFSQVVTKAFRDKGHEAYSCDLLPTEGNPEWHFQEDISQLLKRERFDLGIFHPPCTYLASSGLHWNKRRPDRVAKTEAALLFVRALLDAPIPLIALENPIGCISSRIRKPDQIIQPWQFGEDASKATCLWLKGLPKLQHTNILIRHRYANQTASGQNRLAPSNHRQADRSRTYPGISLAMAEQWGSLSLVGVTPLEMDCRERREYAKQFQEKRSDNPPAAYGRGTHSQAESREAGANYI